MAQSARWGARFGTQVGTKWPADSASAAVWAGLFDSIVSAGGSAPPFGISVSHRLYSGYTGALYRVRRSSDNTQTDIPYDAATNMVDQAALATFCAGTNGFVVTYYDQSGNARHPTQATPSSQHKVYDSATGVTKVNSLPTVLGISSGYYFHASALGFANASSPNVAASYNTRFVAATKGIYAMIGTNGGGVGFTVGATSGGTAIISKHNSFAAERTEFTASPAVDTFSSYLGTWTAGGNFCAGSKPTMRQNGAALTESVCSVGTMSMSLNTYLFGFFGDFTNVMGNDLIVYSTLPTGAVLTAVDAHNTTIRALAA